MKKVLFVIRELCGGGAERALSNIVTHFPDDWDIDILLNNKNAIEYPYKGTILSLDIQEPKNRQSVFHQLNAILKRTRVLRKLKKENHYVACISFLDSSNISNILSGKRYCKTLVSIRGNVTSDKLSPLYRITVYFLIKLLYQHASSIITVSREIEEELIEHLHISNKRITTIENGYDIDKINKQKEQISTEDCKLTEENKIIVTMGRLNKLKGQWHLIRAFTSIANEMPNVKLLILGEGELKGYLQELIRFYHLEDKIIFRGFLSNPFSIIARSDVFVLPSLSEGFPNALAEAMCCGIPCVATDFHSGARELLAPDMDILGQPVKEITEVEYGLLVPLCSGKKYNIGEKLEIQEEYLSESIKQLLQNRQQNEYYRGQSIARSSMLDIETIVKKWIQIIES